MGIEVFGLFSFKIIFLWNSRSNVISLFLLLTIAKRCVNYVNESKNFVAKKNINKKTQILSTLEITVKMSQFLIYLFFFLFVLPYNLHFFFLFQRKRKWNNKTSCILHKMLAHCSEGFHFVWTFYKLMLLLL